MPEPFSDFIRYNAQRGEYGPGDPETQVAQRLELAKRFEPHCFERTPRETRRQKLPSAGCDHLAGRGRCGRASLHRQDPERRAAPISLPDNQENSCLFSFLGWSLNAESHQLFAPNNNEVSLSPVEFDLLYLFLQQPNRVLSRDFLLDRARGRAAIPFDRAIDVHISHLRKKLEPNPQNPKVIRTIRSAGYIFVPTVIRKRLPKGE